MQFEGLGFNLLIPFTSLQKPPLDPFSEQKILMAKVPERRSLWGGYQNLGGNGVFQSSVLWDESPALWFPLKIGIGQYAPIFDGMRDPTVPRGHFEPHLLVAEFSEVPPGGLTFQGNAREPCGIPRGPSETPVTLGWRFVFWPCHYACHGPFGPPGLGGDGHQPVCVCVRSLAQTAFGGLQQDSGISPQFVLIVLWGDVCSKSELDIFFKATQGWPNQQANIFRYNKPVFVFVRPPPPKQKSDCIVWDLGDRS